MIQVAKRRHGPFGTEYEIVEFDDQWKEIDSFLLYEDEIEDLIEKLNRVLNAKDS